ncbi:MAG: hypothetical protein NVSMB27_48480 [Ktedonobacteraceae bacterium]
MEAGFSTFLNFIPMGYRRFDLYLLFGLEAGLLGLIGGLVGAAAAIVVSYLVLPWRP